MKHNLLFPALSLATLLLACAHDKAHQNTSEGNAEARASAHGHDGDKYATDNERSEARDGDGDGVADGVAVPERRADRDRLASANGTVPAAAPASEHEPDNSGINERDRNDKNVTAGDQGNGEVDLDLTQRIRKAVMADDSLSFKAKNTKIITRDGHVTLRGPVKSAAEKDAIYKAAVSAAGVGHVTNQLEVDND